MVDPLAEADLPAAVVRLAGVAGRRAEAGPVAVDREVVAPAAGVAARAEEAVAAGEEAEAGVVAEGAAGVAVAPTACSSAR